MQFRQVTLRAAESRADALRDFYGRAFGLPTVGPYAFHLGTTTLEFVPVSDGDPFYHFAIRVPRNRFEAAREWLGERAELLPDQQTGDTRFDFAFWNAEACYAHDPCGNIVELIAHHELPEETPSDPPFSDDELLGVCELGAPGPDLPAMASALGTLGIELWSGSIDEPGRLAFMGGRDGVLILTPLGRGWLPTGRPAEQWAVETVVAGRRDGEIVLPGTEHRVRTIAALPVAS